jgi:putative nucleotidyltransferase with HDIG domain
MPPAELARARPVSAPTPAFTSTMPAVDDVDLSGFGPEVQRAGHYLLHSGVGFPVLPSAVAEVMALANSPEANFREVDRVVRQDPVIAARVLSVANSPLYRPPNPITSLRVALLRLGWSILREILMQAVAEAHLFRNGPRRELASARLHAIVLAHVHRHVASVVGFDSEHAFVCGLLHDLGRPLTLSLLSDAKAPKLDPAQRTVLVDALHCTIGARVAEAWGLPDVVIRVCRDHHADVGGSAASMNGVSTIAICEALVAAGGFASAPQPDPEACELQLARLGLPAHELESLRSTVEVLCREAG